MSFGAALQRPAETSMVFTEKISVVMPTYNTPVPVLREAVDSILTQTFWDFEFIIIDDCSEPATREYLAGLTDPRIRLIRNETHLGVTKSLNIGFDRAKGRYIARMDSDDVSLPRRLEKQYARMERHPDVIVCGSGVRNFGANNRVYKAGKRNADMELYRIKTLFKNPGPFHPTAFFNHALLLQHGLRYNEDLIYAQDYGLWEQIGRCGRVSNLKPVLLKRRIHPGQISAKLRDIQIRCDQMTQEKQLRELLGNVTEEEKDLHYRFSSGYYKLPICPEMTEWYRRLMDANDRIRKYDRKKFNGYIFRSVIRPAVVRSFGPDMSLRRKKQLLFRYLPRREAMPAFVRYMARELLRRLKLR